MRKSWLQHWMEQARHSAEMSTCASGRKVGAVFIRDNRVLSTGVNGVPSKYPHPLVCIRREENIPSGEGLHKCACAHAEANGIANAAREGVSLKGTSVYVTTVPCGPCMGALANVGVKEIFFDQGYPDNKMSDEIAFHANIPVTEYIEVNGKGMLKID